jgi:hypothetical protein
VRDHQARCTRGHLLRCKLVLPAALIPLAAVVLAASLLLAPAAPGQGACFGSSPTITGSGTIEGTDGDDVIVGSGANDEALGKGGNDKICTGGGNDRAGGGPGNDEVDAGRGDDELLGGAGDDVLIGGAGDDVILCGPNTDVADGGSGTNSAARSGLEACETIRNARAVDSPAPTHRLEATLTRRQEVPRPRSARRARGAFRATLTRTESGGELSWRLDFRRLTGRALAAHIHRGRGVRPARSSSICARHAGRACAGRSTWKVKSCSGRSMRARPTSTSTRGETLEARSAVRSRGWRTRALAHAGRRVVVTRVTHP